MGELNAAHMLMFINTPPEPVVTVQCDVKPVCTGMQFSVHCPAGYYATPKPDLMIRYAEIDYFRQIREVLTASCVKKPEPVKKSKRAKTH